MWYENVSDQVASALGDFGSDYDVAALVREIVDTYGIVSVDTIPSEDFWAVVAKHDQTTS